MYKTDNFGPKPVAHRRASQEETTACTMPLRFARICGGCSVRGFGVQCPLTGSLKGSIGF